MERANQPLQGQRVAVIGGSSGLGFATAELAQQQGADIVIASPTRDKVDEACSRLPGASGDIVDLKQEESIMAFMERLGQIDHIVVTGGDSNPRVFSPTDELDVALVQSSLQIRLLGNFAVIRYGHSKIAEGGSITLTSGMLAHQPRKGAPLTTAIMSSVEGLVRGFALDLAPVRINAVCPGLTATDMILRSGEDRVKAMTAKLPIPRPAQPEEMAGAYVFLMQNHYMTGSIVQVNGGERLV